ncbi:MAG: hypothetical protein WCK90_00135 [archaeon]
MRYLKSSEKKEIMTGLKEQYGIEEVPYLIFEGGKEKTRAFSGSLSTEEIEDLWQIARVEIIGIYVLKKEGDYRLSFDATQLLANRITKGVIEINYEQLKKWMKGEDLDIVAPKGTYVIKYGNDFLGCCKSNGEKLFNYVPKDRRVRKELR